MARLIIASPDGKRGVYEITKPVVTIGRGSANDLVLEHESVSRLHAVIKQSADGVVVIGDRGSTNGVRLNSAPLRAETPIRNGDCAELGRFKIFFESVDDIAFEVRGLGGEPAAMVPTDEAAKLEQLQRENDLLRLLHEASTALHGKRKREAIAEELVELAFRITGVERGHCILMNEQGAARRPAAMRFRQQRRTARRDLRPSPPINLSRAILERITSRREPLLIHDLGSDERFQASESALAAEVRSAMCAPMLAGARLYGIVYVDNLERSNAFTEEELHVLALLAAQAARALEALEGQQKLAEHSAHRIALERFLAPELVEMIAANPRLSLGGVNQKASILFADIRNFTSLSEKMPPERVVDILNAYFSRITDLIFDHGGTLDKFLGDGVMAIFGAPISKGNDAANAVRTGIAIQRLISEMNKDAPALGWPEIQMGIGINTGVVTAGNIGSLKRLDYTVIGDAVNVAARLMSAATGGQILISDSTAQELDSSFRVGGRKPVLLKGKSSPVPVLSVRWLEAKAAEQGN